MRCCGQNSDIAYGLASPDADEMLHWRCPRCGKVSTVKRWLRSAYENDDHGVRVPVKASEGFPDKSKERLP